MDDIQRSQIRGARGLLDWSMLDLAKAAGVSVSVVKRTEGGGAADASAVERMREAFGQAGVDFLADEGRGPGLRLRLREVSPVARFF